MLPVTVILLGPPRLEQNNQTISLGRRKSLALIAYLTVNGRPQSRDHLLALLWPDYDAASGRNNLRRELSNLRKLLGPDILTSDRSQVALTKGTIRVDSFEFTDLMAVVAEHGHNDALLCQDCVGALTIAVGLFPADFMSGFTLPDAPEFNEWLFFEREGLRRELVQGLELLSRYHAAIGQFEQGIGFGRTWLNLDPLNEASHRALMRLYEWSDQHTAALHQFQECERLLKEELGVEPEEETRQLLRMIERKQLEAPTITAANHLSKSQPPDTPQVNRLTRNWPAQLPQQITRFLGRKAELTELQGLLSTPDVRLITILGPGGMGKTRLALACAERFGNSCMHGEMASFNDGLFFVPLVAANDGTDLAMALAKALQLPFKLSSDQPDSLKQLLLNFLRDKRLLLLLDNFEHLINESTLLTDILQNSPDVKMVITSRERLQLHGEHVYPIHGLAYPDAEVLALATDYEAARFFIQTARRADGSFGLAENDHAFLWRICKLVGGMPLGLELAAAWVDMLSLQEIAAEIQMDLDFLQTEIKNLAPRHRSVRAAFNYSWRKLSAKEKSLFAKLSIFIDGFSRQAAQTVTGATLRQMSRLVNKSFLQYDRKRRRYQIHELLRQFGRQMLGEDPPAEAVVRNLHCTFYCRQLRIVAQEMIGSRSRQASAEIMDDLKNIQLAWNYAVAQQELIALGDALDPLYRFYWSKGWFQLGQSGFKMAAVKLQDGKKDKGIGLILGQILARLSRFYAIQGHHEEATAPAEQSLSLLRQYGKRAELIMSLIVNADIQKDSEHSIAFLNEALVLAREYGDGWAVAAVLLDLGNWCNELGDYDKARHYWQEALAQFRKNGDLNGASWMLASLSILSTAQGRYEEAISFAEEAETLAEDSWPVHCLLANGRAQLALEDFDGAEQTFLVSLALLREVGLHAWTPTHLFSLGEVYLGKKEPELALARYQEGLKLAIEYDDIEYVALNHDGLARTYRLRGAWALASEHLSLALRAASASLEIATVLDCVISASEFVLAQDDLEQAGLLAMIVVSHRATRFKTRERSKLLIARLEPQLPPESIAILRERGEQADLAKVMATLPDLFVDHRGA